MKCPLCQSKGSPSISGLRFQNPNFDNAVVETCSHRNLAVYYNQNQFYIYEDYSCFHSIGYHNAFERFEFIYFSSNYLYIYNTLFDGYRFVYGCPPDNMTTKNVKFIQLKGNDIEQAIKSYKKYISIL